LSSHAELRVPSSFPVEIYKSLPDELSQQLSRISLKALLDRPALRRRAAAAVRTAPARVSTTARGPGMWRRKRRLAQNTAGCGATAWGGGQVGSILAGSGAVRSWRPWRCRLMNGGEHGAPASATSYISTVGPAPASGGRRPGLRLALNDVALVDKSS
jgi:hypothetical protein